MDNNNNNDVNFLIRNVEFRLQYQCERIDGMYLGWENRLDTYIDLLEEKFYFIS